MVTISNATPPVTDSEVCEIADGYMDKTLVSGIEFHNGTYGATDIATKVQKRIALRKNSATLADDDEAITMLLLH